MPLRLEAAPFLLVLLLGARMGEPSGPRRAPATRTARLAGPADTSASPPTEEKVRVAVFRHVIDKGMPPGFDPRGPYCLAVGAGDAGRPPALGDPLPGVVERLQGLGVTVRALSHCRTGDILLYTAGIQWRRADEARVNAAALGWVGKEQEAAHVWYTVRLDLAGWTVTGEQVQGD